MIAMNTDRQAIRIKHDKAVYFRNCCLVFAASFAAAFGRMIGFPSSVNVALASVSESFVLSAFAGSALSYLISGSLTDGIVQLCSILAIAAVRLIYPKGERREPFFDAAVSASAMMLFGCVMSIALPSDTYTASLRMINALMCGCIVFAASLVRQRALRAGTLDISGLNGVLVSALYIVFISSLAGVPTPYLNLGRVVGTACLHITVRRYRNIGGAVAGSLTACGVMLAVPSLAQNTFLIASSGLICGAFIRFGSLLSALVFLITSLVSLVAIGVNADTFTMFADLVAGTALFLIIPPSLIKKLLRRVVGIEGGANLAGQATSARLSVASKTLSSIRTQLTLVTDALDRRTREDKLSDRVKTCVCTDCEMLELCERHKDVKASFIRLDKIANTYNSVSMLDVTNGFPGCVRRSLMLRAFNEIHAQMLDERADQLRAREMRKLLAGQLSAMEGILSDLSFRVSDVRSIDSGLSAAVREHFEALGYPNVKACVYVDNCYMRCADVYLTARFKGELVRLTAALSDITECDLAVPTITEFDSVYRMNFCEEPQYELEVKSYCASSGEEYSGDTFSEFSDTPYRKYLVLSDGMGTGKRARLDSMFSVSLVTRLLGAGLSMESAHGLINSLLRVKGWEESFATLDVVRFDLSAASARFLKAGAARSLICRDGSVMAVGGQAFPPGIIENCPPDVSEVKLFDGDIVIVFSDGISEAKASKTAAGLLAQGATLEQLVTAIGRQSPVSAPGGRKDDITVAAARLSRRK